MPHIKRNTGIYCFQNRVNGKRYIGQKIVSEETKHKMSEAWSGEKHYMWGKKHKPETIEKMREAHGGTNAYQFGKKNPNSSSKYFGVKRLIQKGHTYWMADIKIGGKRAYIGFSKDEIEAAKLYDSYVIKHGLPNPLNFPEEQSETN